LAGLQRYLLCLHLLRIMKGFEMQQSGVNGKEKI
jgi:hypothetical protein